MNSQKSNRIKRVALLATLFIIIGIIYAVVVDLLKFGIPCVFNMLTGVKCPGCGITRSLISLLHFQIYDSLKYNALTFFIIAYISLVFINTSKVYIKSGTFYLNAGSEYISVIFLILFIIWGIVRNIIGI